MTFEDVIRRNPDVWMMTKNAVCKKHLMEILKSVYFLHIDGLMMEMTLKNLY